MNITKEVEEITWKVYWPPEFECLVCRYHRATKMVKLTLPETMVRLPLCPECARLSGETLWLMFKGG